MKCEDAISPMSCDSGYCGMEIAPLIYTGNLHLLCMMHICSTTPSFLWLPRVQLILPCTYMELSMDIARCSSQDILFLPVFFVISKDHKECGY